MYPLTETKERIPDAKATREKESKAVFQSTFEQALAVRVCTRELEAFQGVWVQHCFSACWWEAKM